MADPQSRAARLSRGTKFAVGCALPEGELRAWQAATGLTDPAVVPVGVTIFVGRCTLRLDVANGRPLPKIDFKVLTRAHHRPRSHWYGMHR